MQRSIRKLAAPSAPPAPHPRQNVSFSNRQDFTMGNCDSTSLQDDSDSESLVDCSQKAQLISVDKD
jgi:hypothetical protein